MGIGLWMRKKEIIGNSGSKLTMWLQILGARGESEMGRVSLVAMFLLGMRPQHLFLYDKNMVIRLGDGL
jgi:hypothetical protein